MTSEFVKKYIPKEFHQDDGDERSPYKPGLYQIDEELYHSGPGVSRSKLWTVHSKTPYHARYSEKKETQPLKFGKAIHTAVLEPGLFEARYDRGPDARGNSKDWTTAAEISRVAGKTILKPDEYNDALRIRDAAHKNRTVQLLTRGTPSIEPSAYYTDEATGMLCKVRPDIFAHEIRIMGDLKSVTSGSARDFQKSVGEYGYHLQEFMYPLGYTEATGKAVDGFVFICIEKAAPFSVSIFEIGAESNNEAALVYRAALDSYAKCTKWEAELRESETFEKKKLSPEAMEDAIAKTCWPGYPQTVQQIDLPEWAFKMRPR